jgi:selenocysteine-specific elongation factor
MEWEALRDRLPHRVGPRLLRAVVEELEAAGALSRDGGLLRLPGHAVQLGEEERRLVERITTLLGASPLAPPDVKQLEHESGVDASKLAEVIRVMEREGSIVRVAVDLYFLAEHIGSVRDALRRHLAEHGEITTGRFRDLFGTSRKYAIPLLEYFDREGVTLRAGDVRRLRNPQAAVKL